MIVRAARGNRIGSIGAVLFFALATIGAAQFLRPGGDLATAPPHPEKVFTSFLLDASPSAKLGPLLRRHTLDVYAAQADPDDAHARGLVERAARRR